MYEHNIPVGALVELGNGARLFVVYHARDCDGQPLYHISHLEKTWPPNRSWQCGYSEDVLMVVKSGNVRSEEARRRSEAEAIASVFIEILRLAVAREWPAEDRYVVLEAIREQLGPDIASLSLTSGAAGAEEVAKAVVEILWLAHAHRWSEEEKDVILEAVKNQLEAVRTSDE
jgi:hypothetical protein